MRYAIAITMTVHLAAGGSARADDFGAGRSGAAIPADKGLSALRTASSPDVDRAPGERRVRVTIDALPPEARAVHAVLSGGGQLSLAGGPLAVQLELDGRLSLVGPISSQWARADRVLLYGGSLTVDDNIEMVTRDGRLQEARIRSADDVYVLTPPTGRTVRTVGIFREPRAPSAAAGHRSRAEPATVSPTAPPVIADALPPPPTISSNTAEDRGREPASSARAAPDVDAGHPAIASELREIANIEALLREAKAMHAALLESAPRGAALAEAADDLARLDRRVASLWKEADAVIRTAHRAVPDQAPRVGWNEAKPDDHSSDGTPREAQAMTSTRIFSP